MWPHCTCPAFAEPGISVSQKLLDWAVPRLIELQEHPLQREEITKRVLRNRSESTGCVSGSYKVCHFSMYLFQSSVYIHLHLHDKQVRGLDKLLHHLCSVNGEFGHRHYFLHRGLKHK